MTGKANNCLQYDGLDDYVSVEMALPSTDMSHELWFKTTSPDGSLWCVTNAERTSIDHHVYLHGGNLYACLQGVAPIGSSGLHLADGQWHHAAHVFGPAIDEQHLYVDGHLVAQGPIPAAPGPAATRLLIGTCPDANPPFFAGRIAEVRLWQTIASPDQITDYMSQRLWGNEAGLLGYWPLKGGTPAASTAAEAPPRKRGQKSKTTAIDKTRHANGRIHGAERVFDADLQLAPPPSLTNPALVFDGTDDYLEFPNPFLNTETFTLELWLKPEALEPGQAYGILGYTGAPAGWYKPSLWLVVADTAADDSLDAALRYECCDQAGERYGGVIEQCVPARADWVHLAWVNDGTTYTFYRNGTLLHTAESAPARFFAPADTPYRVGYVDSYWQGHLAEVRVWETARTAKQIRQHMKHRLRGDEPGLVACWPLNEGTETVSDVTDQSHNGRVYGARLESTTLQFRAPKSEPPGATIASSTYSPQPDSIYDLLTENNDFRALYQRIHDAIVHEEGQPPRVTLDASVLGAFSMFHTLEELRIASLTITDPQLEFISERDDLDWSSKSAEDSMGLRLRGTTAFLGLSAAQATLECSLDDDHQQATVLKIHPQGELQVSVGELLAMGIELPDPLIHLLNYIGSLHMAAPVLAVASESVEGEVEYPFNLGIDEGLNIYGTLDLTDLREQNPFALIRNWLDVHELALHSTICHHSSGWQITQEAVVEKDTPVLSSPGLELVYKGATVSVDIVGQPPELAVLLSNTLMLSLNWFDTEDLYLTGTMKLEPESFTGAYTLQQSPGSENAWSPFGFEGISVKALAMQLGGTYLAPWIDNVGIATEEVQIGQTQSSLAVLIDTNDPDQFVFHLAINQTTLLELLSALTPVTFAAYQGLPRLWQRALESIVDIDFRDVVIYVVPAPTRIGELVFDDEGILVHGTMSPWGWDATVNVVIDWDDIDLALDVEPFSLTAGKLPILCLEGREDNTHPRLEFARGEDIDTRWYLAAEIVLFGTRHELFSQRDQVAMIFTLASYLPLLHAAINVDQHDGTTTANAKLELVFNLNKPGHSRLKQGDELLGLAVRAALHTTYSDAHLAFELQANALLRWYDKETRLAIAPRLATDIPNLAPAKAALATYALNPIKRLVSRVSGQTGASPAVEQTEQTAPAQGGMASAAAGPHAAASHAPGHEAPSGDRHAPQQQPQQQPKALNGLTGELNRLRQDLQSRVANGNRQKAIPLWVQETRRHTT